MENVAIKIKPGTVIGKKDEKGIWMFKGIPFAEAPIGELRWKESKKVEKYEKDIEAFDFGYSCVQPIDKIEPASLREQNEDCLTLNIWTKEYEGKKPVMIYIHGGGYIGGGSSHSDYDGYNLVLRNEVVYVSINYRCNIFGFIDLEDFGGSKYVNSCNLGLLDQICALEWIKENISHFGGDAENITIFGQSAGGGSVAALMVCAKTKGLFHKAIQQSGTLNLSKPKSLSKIIGKDFVKLTGAGNMEDLLDIDSIKLRDYCDELMKMYGFESELMFAVVTDGILLPEDPYEEVKKGICRGIKLLIGTTADEFNYWEEYFGDLEEISGEIALSLAEYAEIDKKAAKKLCEKYKMLKSDMGKGKANLALVNDISFRIPSAHIAKLQSKFEDTWVYYFNFSVDKRGAYHSIEIPFVFYNQKNTEVIKFHKAEFPNELAEQVQNAWVSFAANGNPSHEGIPEWPKYDSAERKTMIIDTLWKVQSDPGRRERRLIERTMLFSYIKSKIFNRKNNIENVIK